MSVYISISERSQLNNLMMQLKLSGEKQKKNKNKTRTSQIEKILGSKKF